QTEFLTFELVYEDTGSDVRLARYVYVPTAAVYASGVTDFFRPEADTGPARVRIEVFDNGAVKAGPGIAYTDGRVGPYFEDVFGQRYVIPYNHDHYAAACAPDCSAEAPGFFLARVPLSGDRPDADERRFEFADEADVRGPPSWGTGGALAWDVQNLVLAFPAGIRLLVEADLAVEGATLTEAAAGQGWGGVAVYEPGSLDFDAVTVTKAAVGIDVNAAWSTFDGVLLDENGV